MKVISTIVFLILLCFVTWEIEAQKGLQVGARAGAIGVPYTFSSNRLGTGMFVGLYLQLYSTKETNLSLTFDYRKVDNLLIEKLEQAVVVFPDGQYRGTEFLSLSGFSGMRLGLRLDRNIKHYRRGKLKVSLETYAEILTGVKVSLQSVVSNDRFSTALLENVEASFVNFPQINTSISTTKITDDDGNLVFSGGIGLIYEFSAGPQIACSLLLDLNDRFSLFPGAADARLAQVQFGFNYPLSTKTN